MRTGGVKKKQQQKKKKKKKRRPTGADLSFLSPLCLLLSCLLTHHREEEVRSLSLDEEEHHLCKQRVEGTQQRRWRKNAE